MLKVNQRDYKLWLLGLGVFIYLFSFAFMATQLAVNGWPGGWQGVIEYGQLLFYWEAAQAFGGGAANPTASSRETSTSSTRPNR